MVRKACNCSLHTHMSSCSCDISLTLLLADGKILRWKKTNKNKAKPSSMCFVCPVQVSLSGLALPCPHCLYYSALNERQIFGQMGNTFSVQIGRIWKAFGVPALFSYFLFQVKWWGVSTPPLKLSASHKAKVWTNTNQKHKTSTAPVTIGQVTQEETETRRWKCILKAWKEWNNFQSK